VVLVRGQLRGLRGPGSGRTRIPGGRR
jgi:hypothetical protein